MLGRKLKPLVHYLVVGRKVNKLQGCVSGVQEQQPEEITT